MIVSLLERLFKTCFHKVDTIWLPKQSSSIHGRCTKCDKVVLMDSQGNWF